MIARRQPSPVRGLAPDEAASHWLVRLEDGPLDDREQAEFEAWRADSAVNAAAYDRARQAWDVFDHAEGDPHLDALRESARAVGPEKTPRGLWFGMGAGLAASLLAVLAYGTDLLPFSTTPARIAAAPMPAATMPRRPDQGAFVTAKGERRTIDLADGSALTLNTDSAVRLTFSPARRLVRLLRGQVLFEVAKDHRRPFVVQAADRQVTALGTIFQVSLDPKRMKVTLVEGKVVVDSISDRPRNAALAVPTILMPGQQLVAAVGAAPQLAKVDVDQQLRWREGFVEFNDVPLATAVQEMNRYSSRQIVLRDAVRAMPVSGVFRTGNPERFAAIIGELLPIQSRALPGDRIELSPRDAQPR